MLVEVAAAAALICLDPGHGTAPAIAGEREPIGPGSTVTKIKDGGGAAGEATIALAIAQKTRALLLRRGYRVVMTRTGGGYRGGNIARAQFCNRRRAALMLRIHADGAADASRRGVHTLTPAFRRGWTDDVYAESRRAARAIQRSLVSTTRARDLGIHERSDLTGFNWADVPVVLAETGFLSNAAERRLLRSAAYQWRVARGLAAGVGTFHPVHRRASFGVDGSPPRVGVRGERLGRIDGGLGSFELFALLDHRARVLEPPPQILGPRIHRLRLDPPRRPASDPPPQHCAGHRDSSQEREPTVHAAMLHCPPLPAPLPCSVAV